MRRLRAIVLWLASAAVSLALVAVAALFLLLHTDHGQTLLQSQTEALAGRLLGPNYRAGIGRQSISFGRDGRLAIRWQDVSIVRQGLDRPELEAETVAVGVDGLSLLRGEVKLRSLDVSGVDIDVTPVPEASEVAAAAQALAPGSSAPVTPPVSAEAARSLLPALASRLFDRSETQIGALVRLGIERVDVDDVRLVLPVAPGGGPFVAYVERLNADLADPRSMLLTGTLRLDGSTVPVETRVSFDPAAKRLASASSRIGPLDLAKLLPPGDRADRSDMRPFGSDATLTMTLNVASADGEAPRNVRLETRLDKGHVHQGRGHADIEEAGLALRYVEGEDRVAIDRLRVTTDDVEAELFGSVTPVYDRPGDGAFNGFAFDLDSRTLRSSVGSSSATAVATAGRLAISGRTEVSTRLGRLDRFELQVGDGSLTGTGSFGYAGPDARLRLDLAFANMAASAVKAFWPFDIAVAPRAWVVQNIGDAGRVVAGRIELDVLRARMAETARTGTPYTSDELRLDLSLQGVASRTFGELPSLAGADGTVEVRGGDTLVTVAKAGIDGMPDSVMEGGLVTFSRVVEDGAPLTEMRMTANFAGTAKDALGIAGRAPLSSMVQLPVKAEDVQGAVRTVAGLTMHLGDALPNGRAVKSWKADLTLADVGSDTPVNGRRLAGIDGRLALTPDAVEGELSGSIDGADGKAAFRRAIGPAGEQPRLAATLRIDGAEAAKLAPALAGIVSGPIEAKVVQPDNGATKADVDLSAATLDLPSAGWRKGKGVAAKLGFDVASRDGRTAVEKIVLNGDGFEARGRADLDGDGLRKAELDEVRLNPGDDIRATIERVQNGYSVAVRGSRFDARPLLTDIRSDLGGKTATPKQGGRQFDVSATVAEVVGFGKETISDFALNYAGSGSRVAALSISGTNRGAAPFSVELSPRGKKRAIEIGSQNAGALLDFTGAYDHMDGGRLRLALVGDADDGYSGKLELRDFALVDEPRLSRLVAAPPAPDAQSLSQAVGRNFQTARATFDHASAGIGFGKDGLVLRDGIIRGPIFGSSFSGTVYDARNRIDIVGSFMPAYGLNRVFGAIPVVGQILGNGREGGLIGITYKLSGQVSSPRLEINPISAIAPGIFRNIFAYQ